MKVRGHPQTLPYSPKPHPTPTTPGAKATSEPPYFGGFLVWFFLPSPGLCRTVKRFLLAGLALVGSALVVAALLGGLLGLALAVWSLGRRRWGRRRPCPFQVELQSVVGALVPRELEKGGEVGPDSCSLARGPVPAHDPLPPQ